MISACRRHHVRYSITARKNRAIRRAIDAIGEHEWVPIPYWLDGGADVAETTYTAFAGTRHETTARLIVRRVRPTPGSQLAMDVAFSYHAVLTDRTGPLLAVEADHRRHAIVEHTICDLKHHAGLAHLPSGRFAANAAWLALVGIAYNLAVDRDRCRPRAGHDQDAAPDGHRRARPASDQRPKIPAAHAHRLAVGRPHHHRAGHDRPARARARLTPGSRAPPLVRHDPITTAAARLPPGRSACRDISLQP